MDKSALLTERLPRGEIEIEGVGTVTVRGLSRYELLLAGKGQEDVATIERRMLAMGMVDPAMTEPDAEAWQRASPAGEIMPVVALINELSGVTHAAQKEAYKSFREESGA